MIKREDALLAKFIGKKAKPQSWLGVVTSVDKYARTATVQIDGSGETFETRISKEIDTSDIRSGDGVRVDRLRSYFYITSKVVDNIAADSGYPERKGKSTNAYSQAMFPQQTEIGGYSHVPAEYQIVTADDENGTNEEIIGQGYGFVKMPADYGLRAFIGYRTLTQDSEIFSPTIYTENAAPLSGQISQLPATNKYLVKTSITFQGQLADLSWVTIASSEYSAKKKSGKIQQNVSVSDWGDYGAYRISYQIKDAVTGAKTTYTNVSITMSRQFISPAAGIDGGVDVDDVKNVTLQDGHIGGFTIDEDSITADSGLFTLNSVIPEILMGSATAFATGVGVFEGKDSGTYKWRVGDPAGNKAQWDGSTFSVTGTIVANAGSIGGWTINSTYLAKDTGVNSTSAGLSPTDYSFYSGSTYANRATAPFRVTPSGALTATSATITGNITTTSGTFGGNITVTGTIRNAASPAARYELTAAGLKGYDSGNVQRYQILNDGSGWLGSASVLSWTAAGVVSLNGSAVVNNSLDAGKTTFTAPTLSGLTLTNNSPVAGSIAWSSFTLTYQGTTYTIASGNTANKYLYWNKATSTTVLQTSASVPSNAPNMFMVAVNLSGTAYQSNFAPFVYADYIAAGTITATQLAATAIDSMTITGATIRTASSGARTEMNASNLFGLGFGGIGGTDGTTTQWYAKASDGKIYFAGGKGLLSANNIEFIGDGGQYLAWKTALGGSAMGYVQGSSYANAGSVRIGAVGYNSTQKDAQSEMHVSTNLGRTSIFRLYGNDASQTGGFVDYSVDSAGSWATVFRVGGQGDAYINDNSNANTTVGITINQGTAASSNEIIALKQNNTAHGMTSETETDTFGAIREILTDIGGISIHGYSETTQGIRLRGYIVTGDTARATTALGAALIDGFKKSGTNGAAMGTNENILVVRDGTNTRFIVDKEGDIHMDATSNINAWDDFNDVKLLEAFRIKTAGINFKESFVNDVELYAKVLHDTGVLTLNDDGHHFVSMKGFMGLTIDAIRQLAHKVEKYESAFMMMGIDVKSLE